jgi:hypothetical protein
VNECELIPFLAASLSSGKDGMNKQQQLKQQQPWCQSYLIATVTPEEAASGQRPGYALVLKKDDPQNISLGTCAFGDGVTIFNTTIPEPAAVVLWILRRNR